MNDSRKLSAELAKLAKNIRDRINSVLEIEIEDAPITKLMSAFKEVLIHDLDNGGFADMYAQTIAYGLLSARITDPKANSEDDFTKAIPITNPFLKELMETFLNLGRRSGKNNSNAGLGFDQLGVGELVDFLDYTDIEAVVRDFRNRNINEDPIIQFYEGFAKEYDPIDKVRRGEFYTPWPVVSFIVRSVDEMLRTEFDLEDGLADTTTWGEIITRIKNLEITEGVTPDQTFVQVLDPATGTGTFLVEVIDVIYKTMTSKWEAQDYNKKNIAKLWNDYVPKHLLPRLYAFELKMAPYTIAHMTIGLKLRETGYRFGSNERARVYLTNAIEPAQDFSGTMAFTIPALAHEAEAVNTIKRNHLFTVVIGNPPYSGHSWNLTPKLRKTIDRYRYVGTERIRERGALQLEKNLQDDYVKFICFAESLIERSGSGVSGFVTSHGFLDNIFLRGMRYSLVNTYDKLFFLDLHGNVLRGDKAPDGSRDQNVFDIKQTGAAISIVRKVSDTSKTLIEHSNLWGDRTLVKFPFLGHHTISSVSSNEIYPSPPQWMFTDLDEKYRAEYEAGESLIDIMPLRSLAVVTGRDKFIIDDDKENLIARITDFAESSETDTDLDHKFGLRSSSWWSSTQAKKDMPPNTCFHEFIRPLTYRPFDNRLCFYHPAVFESMRRPVFKNVDPGRENLILITTRITKGEPFAHTFVSNLLVEAIGLSSKTSNSAYAFPLYWYPGEPGSHLLMEKEDNFSPDFKNHFAEAIGRLSDPKELFYYIYSLLHSPTYRSRYAEFLKNDFPRVLFPDNPDLVSQFARLGAKLVSLHLMESPMLDHHISTLVGSGNFQVEKVSYSRETVWIDKAKVQGIRGVPEEVWNFRIGGYQVCEKWLKYREARGGKNPHPGRILSNEDINHYKKIVVALNETIRIMAKIDEVIEEHGGWPDAFAT